MRHHVPPDEAVSFIRERLTRQSVRSLASELGLERGIISRVADGRRVRAETAALLSRIVPRVRKADEFRGAVALQAPRQSTGPYSWDLETIRGARDDQMRGVFQWPVRMAEAMRTDDAIFVPRRNRVATSSAIETRLVPCEGARGEALARKAAASVFAPKTVLSGIHGTLADHGIAIGYVEREPTEDGTRVDMRLTEWPLEFVRWVPHKRVLETRVDGGLSVPIVHGDGQWIIFRKTHDRPWVTDACVSPAALVWAAHANGIRDWAQSSRAHGLAKILGQMADGTALANEDGTLTLEAQAFLKLLQGIVSGDGAAGILPQGSKAEFAANGSSAWQIFVELVTNREKAGARIYLGTDAILGSIGGAPGVDIAALFAIASTLIQGDLTAIEQGLQTGLYEPWAAINAGSSLYAPKFKYQIPDPDAERKALQREARMTAFLDTLGKMKGLGLTVNQDVVNRLAAERGIEVVPELAPEASASVPLVLAPTDVAKVVRVREARASQGLPPFGDARDEMTMTELDQANQAKADAASAAPTPAP